MKRTILKNDLKSYQCKERNIIDKVIEYYKEYNIIEKKKNYEEEKTITGHTKCVTSLLRLKDGRVASCSLDKTIRIYDPSNDYHCDKVIKRHSKGINSICELSDGTIVSYSADKSIMIGDYRIINAHDEDIIKVISLSNNRIASCGGYTIKIWKSNPPYSSIPITILEEYIVYVTSLLYIKERDIMIYGCLDKILLLWNMSTYQCEQEIEGVECSWINALYQIDSDRVIVGGKNIFRIVNIDKCVIEKKIRDQSLGNVRCFLKLRDNKTILCGCDNGSFCFYDMETEQYKTTRNNHKDNITDLLLMDENTFLSCSKDETIRVWKY